MTGAKHNMIVSQECTSSSGMELSGRLLPPVVAAPDCVVLPVGGAGTPVGVTADTVTMSASVELAAPACSGGGSGSPTICSGDPSISLAVPRLCPIDFAPAAGVATAGMTIPSAARVGAHGVELTDPVAGPEEERAIDPSKGRGS